MARNARSKTSLDSRHPHQRSMQTGHSAKGAWQQGARLAAVCLLFLNAVLAISQTREWLQFSGEGQLASAWGIQYVAGSVLAVAAFTAALRGRFRVALIAYLGTTVCTAALMGIAQSARYALTANNMIWTIPTHYLIPVIAITTLLAVSALSPLPTTKHSWAWIIGLVAALVPTATLAISGIASWPLISLLASALLLVLLYGWLDARFSITSWIIIATWSMPMIAPQLVVARGASSAGGSLFDLYWGRSPATYTIFASIVATMLAYSQLAARRAQMA